MMGTTGFLLVLTIVTISVVAGPYPHFRVNVNPIGHLNPRGVLDGFIEGLIDNLRPNLVNLVLPDINAHINSSGIVANLTTTNITTNNLDTFTVDELKTTLLPLRLDQLTLHWDEFSLSGPYTLDGDINLDVLQGPIEVAGIGNASISLRNVTLKAGAIINSAGGHIQIKEITQLTIALGESTVILENIFGGEDMEIVINVFLSFFLPELVNDFGDEFLKVIEPVLIEKINEILLESGFP